MRLEDYLDRFLYNLKTNSSLSFDIIRTIYLKGIHDEYIDILNLMGSGDISYLPFEQIVEMCRKYSRGKAKARKGQIDALSKITKSATGSIKRARLGNLLEIFKTDLLSTLGSQIDTLKAKKKQEEQNETLSIFFPKCKKSIHQKIVRCSIQVCGICAEDHSTENCPLLSRIKSVFKGESGTTKSLYYVSQRIPWHPHTLGMSQDHILQFPSYSNPNYVQTTWNALMPWQAWSPHQPNQQGWRAPTYGNKPMFCH
jgi:hypothetical protein